MKKLVDKFKRMTLVQAVFVMAYGALAVMWGVYYGGYLCGTIAAGMAG